MEKPKIILFDGICNLCNSFVQRVIKNDSKNIFKFASLQSDFGQNFLKTNHLDHRELKTIILVDGEKFYTKSTAALKIGKELKGIYQISSILIWIPRPIRDFVYDIVSRNRYSWFGRQDSCWIPTPELKNKFIN